VRRGQVVVGVAAALAAHGALAFAAPSIGVIVTGEPTLQAKVRARITLWSQQHGYTVAPHPLPADAQKTLANCFVIEDTACARGVFEHQASSDYLVFVRVELARREKEVSLVGYWFLKDREAVADKRTCKPCTSAALGPAVGELMGSLFDATALAKSRLRINSPPALVVMLDGANVGVTPLEQDVSPGSHAVELVRDGAPVGSVTVEVKAGEITDVAIPIKAEAAPQPTLRVSVAGATPPPAEAPAVEHRPSRILPGVVMAVGAGAVIVGGVFVYYGHRNGPDDPLIYPDATKQGAIIAGVGGAALIAGLVWWLHDASASSGPIAAVGASGTLIGWGGHF
jgi:hypothetical protein